MTQFWIILPIFGAKDSFPENPAQSRTTSYGLLASCKNLEKTNGSIPRKYPDRQKEREGQMDRRKYERTEGRADPIS